MPAIYGIWPSAIVAVDDPAGRPRHVVIVGLPGVGKTTVGRAVALILGRPFVDLDTEIERAFGKSVADIFAERGESEFRQMEVESSRQAALQPPAIISPGGGWVANEAAMAHLRATGRIIYLRVSPEMALQRMGRGVLRRPLLATGNPRAAMQALFETRRPLYEACADLTIETDGMDRLAVVEKVMALVREAESGDKSSDTSGDTTNFA